MKQHRNAGILALALVLAGCGTAPRVAVPPSSAASLGYGDAVAANYQADVRNYKALAIASLNASSQLGATLVGASSVRNPLFFAAGNATDDNLHSAWEPASADHCPTLTFDLVSCTDLCALAIKMDQGATFDVAVSTDGETWTTIATGLTPQYQMLDLLKLQATLAAHVRLTFHVSTNCALKVCDVQFFGNCETPAPSPTPTPTPTPTCGVSGELSDNLAFDNDVTGTAGVSGDLDVVTDDTFAPEGTVWNDPTYAVTLQTGDSLTIDLGRVECAHQLVFQADDNDSYRIDFSTDGTNWMTMSDNNQFGTFGLTTRPPIDFAPTQVRYIRVTPDAGDGLYGVSEVQLF